MVLGGGSDTHIVCVEGGSHMANHGQRVQSGLA